MAKYPSDRDADRRDVTRYPFAIDVEIVCGGHEQSCKTFDLSLRGMFVLTDELCELNQIVRVRAFMPNVKRPIDWMGRVTRVVTPEQATPEQPSGLAVRIFGISDRERLRWTDLISKASQACEDGLDPREQRKSGPTEVVPPRKHVRYRTPLYIDIQNVKRLFRFVARDVSAGGVFIPTKIKIDKGALVSLMVRHPVTSNTFEIDGEVVRVEPDGLAVGFRGLDDERRKALQRFIVSGQAN